MAVGVDAETGVVRNPQMRAESLNAAFFTVDIDEGTGNYVVSIANQMRAMDNHVLDIPEDGLYGGPGLTAGQALSGVIEKLKGTGEEENWQIGYISNTGVARTALSAENKTPEAGLMRPDGKAGQWIFELFGLSPTPVSDGTREGWAYPFRQLLCTTGGVVNVDPIDRMILTSPLARSPLPQNLMSAYENARTFAVKVAGQDFRLMSAGLSRSAPESQWHFRFYDSGDIIAKVVISADGHRLITSTGRPSTGEVTV
jgi:hypothetical protein